MRRDAHGLHLDRRSDARLTVTPLIHTARVKLTKLAATNALVSEPLRAPSAYESRAGSGTFGGEGWA